MTIVGKLDGRAALLVDGVDRGEVRFSLEIRESGTSKDGHGSIDGDRATIFAAYTSGRAALRIEDGRVIPIVVVGAGDSLAAIKTNGPVPGF